MRLKEIPIDDFICFEDYTDTHPVKTDVVYAKANHRDNIFKTAIYKGTAKIWGHRDIVELTLRAAEICYQESGLIFEIKDCLRPFEAQQRMQETDIVKENPHWCEAPNRLLSPPGKGGHPRGMAVDIILVDRNGEEVEMGTRFDALPLNPDFNRSSRSFVQFSIDEKYNETVLENRLTLENSMLRAARERNQDLLPLPQEWWDFRFPDSYTSQFAPIRDLKLPFDMKIVKW